MTIREVVNKAIEHENTWQGDGKHNEEVLFDGKVFTVGWKDLDNAGAAEYALEVAWKAQDQMDGRK